MSATDPQEPPDPRIVASEALRRRIDADVVVVHEVVSIASNFRPEFAHVCVVGKPDVARAMTGLEGQPLATMQVDLSTTFAVNGFGFARMDTLPQGVANDLWAPLRLADAMGALLLHEGQIATAVCAMRYDGHPPFAAPERQRANQHVDALRQAALAYHDSHAHLTGPYGCAVIAPSGEVSFHTESLHADGEALSRGSKLARAFLRSGEPHCGMVGTYRAHLRHLTGPHGEAVCLRLQPTHRVHVNPAMHLSHLKRRVVAYAVQGATVREIAEAMQRSPETIRAHLKQVYEQLGVSSRVDLAQACRQMWLPPS